VSDTAGAFFAVVAVSAVVAFFAMGAFFAVIANELSRPFWAQP
jgi:hypothetical protein